MLEPIMFTLRELYTFQFEVTLEEYNKIFLDGDEVWVKFIQCGRNVLTLYGLLDSPNRFLLQILIVNVLRRVNKG